MKKIPTFIPVVAVALIRGDGKILLQQRRLGGAHGGLWEFPGGKIEEDESAESALVREIAEELGCTLAVEALRPLTFASDARQPQHRREPYVILLYTCRDWHGEPQCLEGEAIAWFDVAELASLSMPPLDRPLSEVLAKSI